MSSPGSASQNAQGPTSSTTIFGTYLFEPSQPDNEYGNSIAGSSSGSSDSHSQSPSESTGRGAGSSAIDRKRRLTNTSTDGGSFPQRQSRMDADPGPSSSTASVHRPLPQLPSGGNGNGNGGGDSAPGSSRENAIDLSSPTTSPRPRHELSRQHSRSSPTLPTAQDNFMEYTLPRWQPDSEVTHCPICGIQFNLWYRKHHCRKCGRVVCASCSPHRITIPRQFIVRPPDSKDSSRTIDLMGNASQRSPRSAGYAWNPALGGGEEVRLCNPCVPDPNLDPPAGYGHARSGPQPMPGSGWGGSFPSSSSRHRAHRSLSGSQSYDPREGETDWERYDRMMRRYGGGSSGTAPANAAAFSSRYAFPYDSQPPYSSLSGLFGGHHPAPGGSHHRARSDYSGSRSPVTRSDRPRHSDHARRAPIDERDICPVCGRPLPPRGEGGDESAREDHIRTCIENNTLRGRSPPSASSPSTQPPYMMRMLSFKATEKDCVNEDGTPQECTICMEEYEVGVPLARLECLCKFHKSCIVEWFERKKECPVHKVS